MKNPTHVRAGDAVCFSALFLRSTGGGATDPRWFARGTIDAIDDGIATVSWKGGALVAAPRVSAFNLARVGSLAACEPIHPVTGESVRV